MKLTKIIVVALLAMSFSALADAQTNPSGKKWFNPSWRPEGCVDYKMPDGSKCYNPYNEKFNAAWEKGDLKLAAKFCDKIHRNHVPELSNLGDQYKFCAESGDVRSIGKYAGLLYQNGYKSAALGWASKGMEAYKAPDKYNPAGYHYEPHPNAFLSWYYACLMEGNSFGACRGAARDGDPEMVAKSAAEDENMRVQMLIDRKNRETNAARGEEMLQDMFNEQNARNIRGAMGLK